MKYRRILALLLATLMLSACFVGCQSGGTDTPTTVATTTLPSETVSYTHLDVYKRQI